jgi:hypothetical protein
MKVAKASMSLPSGATVTIEGTSEEVARILEINGGATSSVNSRGDQKSEPAAASKRADEPGTRPSVAEIVNLIKSCDAAERIEAAILDKSSQLDRTLLPLYTVREHFPDASGVTTGEISAITTDLGSPVSAPNVSHTIRGAASKYVIVDISGPQDGPARYKINRRGVAYMKALLGHPVLEN